MRITSSPELDEALQEYEDVFFEEYPIHRDNLHTPEANVAEIRRRIRENDPARPMTAEEELDLY